MDWRGDNIWSKRLTDWTLKIRTVEGNQTKGGETSLKSWQRFAVQWFIGKVEGTPLCSTGLGAAGDTHARTH